MVRKASILVLVGLLTAFVWLNWDVLSTVTPISLHARVLRDVRAIAKALHQKELADREEAARLVDLRIDFMRALEEGFNATAASIGELEDRMERAKLLSRGDETAADLLPAAPASRRA